MNIKSFLDKAKHPINSFRKNIYIPAIDFIEINYGHFLVKEPNFFIPKNPPKIALVKQEVYQDLYCCPTNCNPKEVIFSSLKRTGMVGLFTKLDTDFWIVKVEPDPECNVWQEKTWKSVLGDWLTIESLESLKTQPYLNGKRGHKNAQGDFAISVSEIDWSKYDIVISLDISVPERLTRTYPNTVWCYYIGEPSMPSYKRSYNKPIAGYDLFLNQKFNHFKNARSFRKKPEHVLEFPYCLQYYNCFQDILGKLDRTDQDPYFMMTKGCYRKMTQEQLVQLQKFGLVNFINGTTEEIIQQLLKSKYFIALEASKKHGNGVIEAVASGCLLVGNPDKYAHKSLFTQLTAVKNFQSLLERLMLFENNNDLYEREVKRQRKLVNYLCFTRPLKDLFEKAEQIKKNRSNTKQ